MMIHSISMCLGQHRIIFDIPSIDGVQQPQLNARLGLSSHLNESQMVYGRLPED